MSPGTYFGAAASALASSLAAAGAGGDLVAAAGAAWIGAMLGAGAVVDAVFGAVPDSSACFLDTISAWHGLQ